MTQPSADDQTLIAHIARGERWAFEALYERYADQALGLAMRMLRDRAVSEDVLQDAFWRVWQRAAHFDHERGNVRAWLLTIVHRLAIDVQRRNMARPVVEMDAHDDHEWDIEDHEADVSEYAVASISSAEVRKALADLPEKHRTVIELAYFHGMTHREIAERLGEPLGTIHSRALQGMAALKQLLRQRV
jgi:RNA polymerase sigma-70 factor (ECF subfamily)